MSSFILSGFADEAASNLDEQLFSLKQADMNYIEMRMVDGENIIDCSDEKLFETREKLKAQQVRLSAIGSYIGKIKITDDFEPHLDKFKRAVEIALILNAPNIRIFSFYIPHNEDPLIYRDEVMERMTALINAAHGSGVSCCHENEKDIYGDTPERVLDLFKTLGTGLKGIFDPANFVQCNVNDIVSAFEILVPFIEYMHIKDAKLSDGAVVLTGFGDGKIKELLALFSKKDGNRFLTMEPHLSVFKGFDKLGDEQSIKNEYIYENTKEAFLAGVNATKEILLNIGYKGENGIWKR